jgi:hypothetical protein
VVNHYKKTAGRGAKNAKQDKGQQFNQDGFHSFYFSACSRFWLDKNASACDRRPSLLVSAVRPCKPCPAAAVLFDKFKKLMYPI